MVDGLAHSFSALEALSSYHLYREEEYPMVSLIVVTWNSGHAMAITIKNLLQQSYPHYELIIIDASSSDRTLEWLEELRNERLRMVTFSDFRRYEMMNEGIAQAKGEYVQFLFPGDTFISRDSLKIMMSHALDAGKPHLLYCGSLLHHGRSDAETLLRPFTRSELEKGRQPTSLQSSWWRKSLFETLAPFDTSYAMRAGFELMCRFINRKELSSLEVERVLIDCNVQSITRKMILSHFWETGRAVRLHFGFIYYLRWLCVQKDLGRLYRSWMRSFKIAFLGRN